MTNASGTYLGGRSNGMSLRPGNGSRSRIAGPAPEPLSPAQRAQQQLEDLFLAHQERIVTRDFETAGMLLQGFRALLSRRMNREARMLPDLFAKRAESKGRASAQIERHVSEHRRILALLDKLCAEFRTLLRPQPSHLHVIALIEREAKFKRLLQRHNECDLREVYRRLGTRIEAATIGGQ